MKNKLIVLEGLDGSGKTSIGKYLEAHYGFGFRRTPGEVFEKIRGEVDRKDVFTKLLFYYASNFEASEQLRKALKQESIVCDRYFYSTLVYFAYFSGYSIQEALDLMEGFTGKLLLPDVVIYLTISNETRMERLKERELVASSTDEYFIKNIHRCYAMEKLYMELMTLLADRVKYVVIEAEQTVEETCEQIKNALLSI